jgi:hypothetical protein
MSSKLSVEEVLSNLERRAEFHREQEALHARQVAHHQEQQAIHGAELAKVLENLEAFRGVAATAVDLARPLPPPPGQVPAVDPAKLPPPGRSRVARLLKLVVESPGLPEPFGATAVAAEASRRFADHLSRPVDARTASDILRRLLAEGEIRLVREGRPFHEALYAKRSRAGASSG